MSAVLCAVLLAAAVPEPQYAAAAIDPPADATPQKMLSQWDALMVERQLAPDLVDHRDGLALGDWLARPHVCTGKVRYHAVIHAQKTLRFYVVAECSGAATNLDRAAAGLAEELAKRLGQKAVVQAAQVKDVPARLWEARTFRGNNTPPETPASPAPAPAPR